jgi:hypothetical protein
MTKTEIINEINRLEKMNKGLKNATVYCRNTQFFIQINTNEIKRLKGLLGE